MSSLSHVNSRQDTLVIRAVPNYSGLRLGNMKLDSVAFSVSTPYGRFRLTKRETRILEMMMDNPGSLVMAEMLCENIRESGKQETKDALWVDLFYLRQKMVLIHADYQIRIDQRDGYRLEKIK